MDKDVERVLLHQAEQRKQQLQNEISDLKQQINNMSEQANNPYVDRINEKNNVPQVQYSTVSNDTLAGLDADVTQALNDGWQPAAPQYKADGWFYQPMIRVPREMMQPQR